MARLFLTEYKFLKLSKARKHDVRVVLSAIENESERIVPERDSWNSSVSYINRMSGYNANVVIDGKIAFSVNASILHRITRSLEEECSKAFDQLPPN